MADRSFLWGGRSPQPRRASEHSGRRRHDQQRLLVELELDDSLYQGTLRPGFGQNGPLHQDAASGRRTTYATDSSNSRHFRPSYDQNIHAAPRSNVQSRTPRDTVTKPLTERQMQQLHARRLSSPYKLKQQVIDTRNDPTPHRYQQQQSPPYRGSLSTAQRTSRSSSVQQSPAQIVIESIRQNIHLRDQVLAHLQQELMGVLPLHRASHTEKNVPQRVVKLLNRLRSLSLAVVEAVVYLTSEMEDSNVSTEHEILEQEFYGYLLQMVSSDTDFLACSPPLQRFFEDFEVNLTRNPFVDGLSLDSSEVLLCSCHQSSSSDRLFCSASSSSLSLLRLLTQKLEEFALQTQRYLTGWQLLPAERVAAALLHLMDIETRFNALRTLPRYLQAHGGNRRYTPPQLSHQQRGTNDVSYGYGTFEEERIQRLDRQDSQVSHAGGREQARGEAPVLQAWAGSPTLKASSEALPTPSNVLKPNVTTESLSLGNLSESARRLSRKDEDAWLSSSSPSAWIQAPTPVTAGAGASISQLDGSCVSRPSTPVSATLSSSRRISSQSGSLEIQEEGSMEITPLVLPLPVVDTAAIAKSSRRSNQSERPASKKRSRTANDKCGDRSTFVDVGIQMSEPSTPTAVVTQNDDLAVTKRSVRNHLARSMRDEAIQVDEDEYANVENKVPGRVVATQPNTDEGDDVGRPDSLLPEMNVVEQFERIKVASFEDAMPQYVMECDNPCTSPPLQELTLSHNTHIDGKSSGLIDVDGTPTTEEQVTPPVASEAGSNEEAGLDNDDSFECDFEYSSNEALSSIAMALQMLPSFSFSKVESTLADEVLKPEEAIPPNAADTIELSTTVEYEDDLIEITSVPAVAAAASVSRVSPASTQREVTSPMETARSELENVEQGAELPELEEDEYTYSSTTAVSNIAMALSLLPNVCRDDALSVTYEQSEHAGYAGFDSPRISTYRSIESEEPRYHSSMIEVPIEDPMVPLSPRSNISERTGDGAEYSSPTSYYRYSPAMTSENTVNSSPASSRSNASVMASGQGLCYLPASSRREIPLSTSDQDVQSLLASSRSNMSATTSYQGDDESEPSEFNRIFALCRDIQVAAYDMSHWVSQREVEDHIQSVAQPFSSLMGYSSPKNTSAEADNAPMYLERELKMLRRNFASWKVACAEQNRARLVVRRLVARRKVRQFVLSHHQRRLQAQFDEDNRLRVLAASMIQRNWRIDRHNQQVAQRKAAFRSVHMAFQRSLFFVGISRRRRRRECAKETVVRWWRRQRLRIKKKKLRQEKIAREKERRSRALKDIQLFLKEILLRRKLKAAQEMAKNILFKEQLKWTKAKRDVERSMKLNSKHRRELIADMNARLADLDRQWKTSKQERLQLLTHHERIVQQQQHSVEVRRRKLAALKIQTFFRVCVLHKKLQRVESEKKQFELKLREELLAKEKLDVEAQKRVGKTRTQVRVLERKLGRMAQEAVEAGALHLHTVQAHQEREQKSQERAARQRIKYFIDARVFMRRAERERCKLLLEKALLLAEKRETELMSSEDQLEHRRTAILDAFDLHQRLSELEARSQALILSNNQLAAEREEEALQAAATLGHTRVEASMQQIASWVSGKIQLSKLKREKSAIRASGVQTLEEEKRRQRKEIEAKMREVTSIKTSSVIHQRISQHRNQKIVEMIRTEQQQQSAQDKVVAERTRARLVQVIIDVKLLAERESSRGITQGAGGVALFCKAQQYKFARLKYLRSMNCARKIHRVWRRWMHHQRIKRAQELALAQLEEAKQRQALARRLQAWWRRWVHEQQRRQEQQLVFNAHIEMIRVRANVRKIQGGWRRWCLRERERRREQQRAFDSHLETIWVRANVRNIQVVWRRWVECENVRKREQQHVFDAHLDAIRTRANMRKIQSVWRRWVQCEKERRYEQILAFEAHLKAIRTQAHARKIQGLWRRWVKCENERRQQQHLAFEVHLDTIRQRAYVRKIQGVWRRWVKCENERRQQQHLAFEVHLDTIRQRAYVRKIQGVWRRWVKLERERRHQQQVTYHAHLEEIRARANARKIQGAWRRWVQVQCERERRSSQQQAFNAHLGAIRQRANVRKIQGEWRRWVRSEQERKRLQQLTFDGHLQHIRIQANVRKIQGTWRRWVRCKQVQRESRRIQQLAFSSAFRIQRWWRQWQQKQREKDERIRFLRDASAQVIQRKWQQAEKRKVRIRIQQEVCARKLQKCWRQLREWKRRRDESSKLIQEHWKKWQKQKKETERLRTAQLQAAVHIQRQWRQWQCMHQFEKEKARRRRIQHLSLARIQSACCQWWYRKQKARCEVRAVESIQRVWRRWRRRSLEKAERKREGQEQRAIALRIQQNWMKQRVQRNNEEVERKKHLGAKRIQRKWCRWHRQEEAMRVRKSVEENQRVSAILLQRAWKKYRPVRVESERLAHPKQEQERRAAAALIIQSQWRQIRLLEAEGQQLQQHACAYKIQELWRKWYVTNRSLGRDERIKLKADRRKNASALKIQKNWRRWRLKHQKDDERMHKEYVTNALKIQTFWRRKHKERGQQCEKERLVQTQHASSVKIQRNWGLRQHRRKMENERIQHEQHMSALTIQTAWLRWHNEQQEELERERIRQEQYESSLKIQRGWGISQRRRKVSQERIRHKQNMNALKIQKHWRRWRHLRLELRNRCRNEAAEPRKPCHCSTTSPSQPQDESATATTTKPDAEQDRQQRLHAIKRRSYGRCVARAVKRFHKSCQEQSAATKIEAIWKGKLYRSHYLQALEMKRAEEARRYRLMISVFAAKVQGCWRQWHKGVRQVKRSVVKSDELRLIEEAKALERKILMAKRALAAKRIQRALASRKRLIATNGVSHRHVDPKEEAIKLEEPMNKVHDEELVDPLQPEEYASDFLEPVGPPHDGLTRVTVVRTVEDWSHRELPHIMTRSVNQILFYHDAANVIQKSVRGYQRRQQMQCSFQCSLVAARDPGSWSFRFYFKRASAWLDWDRSKTRAPLRLRFDSQMTRRLLHLFEPSEEYSMPEILQALQEIAVDALPILQSPVCVEDNHNPRPELRYHDVEEMELPLSVKLMRQMGQRRAQVRRQQLLEVDTSLPKLPTVPMSPVAKTVPSSSVGKSAPSSPSQRAKMEVTIFTAVESASVEDATFLQQRGADLGALELKTQRNALHMLSFSKENYRSRAEMLEFLLNCGANLDVNAMDCNGVTPLMLYASLGHLEFMQKLLERGADILKTNSRGQNVLHRACEEDQVEICGFLQQLMSKDSIAENIIPIKTIAALAPVRLFLHTADSTGRYPLHYLAEKGFVECAKQLMVPTEANFDWNCMLQAHGDLKGRTALHLAVLTHDAAMTAFLLTPGGGSNVNAFDELHRSPLHYAVESPAALPIISRLVQHGANLNVADERGDTPLHWAAFSGRAAVAQNLLALGADPTPANSDWETPAQIAAAYGQLDCMRLLLQAQRRYGAAPTGESKEQQLLIRPASEKTALQRLEEAVNHLHQKQAAAQSYHAPDQDTDADAPKTNDSNEGDQEAAVLAEQSRGGYWEELHQDVQLVEESGQFSSEDEEDLLFGEDDDDTSF